MLSHIHKTAHLVYLGVVDIWMSKLFNYFIAERTILSHRLVFTKHKVYKWRGTNFSHVLFSLIWS